MMPLSGGGPRTGTYSGCGPRRRPPRPASTGPVGLRTMGNSREELQAARAAERQAERERFRAAEAAREAGGAPPRGGDREEPRSSRSSRNEEDDRRGSGGASGRRDD